MVMVHVPFTMVAVLTATIVFAAPADAPQIAVTETAGVYHVTAAFTVPSSPAKVAAVLTDYERIPEFMPDVTTSQVLSRTAAGLVVEQHATATFMMFSKSVHLVLEVSEHGDAIRFRDRCGKSFTTYQGEWRLIETTDGTAVLYALTANPSFDVPGFVLKRLLKRDAALMIDRLKAEIRARADLRQ
jgi:ribosome-associated toxin RatA of RatAB toxin-antitoxin module